MYHAFDSMNYSYLFAVQLELIAPDAREADSNSQLVLEILQGTELIEREAALDGVECRVLSRLVQFRSEETLLAAVEPELKHNLSVVVRLNKTFGMTDPVHTELKE